MKISASNRPKGIVDASTTIGLDETALALGRNRALAETSHWPIAFDRGTSTLYFSSHSV